MVLRMDTGKALQWLTDVLGVQERTLTLEDTRMSVAEWDSLGVLMILSRLEEDHAIFVSADDLAQITSVKEICDLLQKNNIFVS